MAATSDRLFRLNECTVHLKEGPQAVGRRVFQPTVCLHRQVHGGHLPCCLHQAKAVFKTQAQVNSNLQSQAGNDGLNRKQGGRLPEIRA